MKKVIVTAVFLLLVTGCVRTIDEDGNETFSLAPSAEKGAQGGLDVMAALTPVFPWLGGVVAAGATALGTYKKMKPKINQAQSQERTFHTATQFLVEFFDDLKKDHPDIWKKEIAPKIRDCQWGRNVENAVRGLRGKEALPEAA